MEVYVPVTDAALAAHVDRQVPGVNLDARGVAHPVAQRAAVIGVGLA